MVWFNLLSALFTSQKMGLHCNLHIEKPHSLLISCLDGLAITSCLYRTYHINTSTYIHVFLSMKSQQLYTLHKKKDDRGHGYDNMTHPMPSHKTLTVYEPYWRHYSFQHTLLLRSEATKDLVLVSCLKGSLETDLKTRFV